jgi:hypothetical protein
MAGSQKCSKTFSQHFRLSILIDNIIGLVDTSNNRKTNQHYIYLMHLFTSEAKLIIRLFLEIRN